MDLAIYRKTNKGIETIEQRCHALSGRMRGVLIMVDGMTPRARLEERLAALGTPPAAIDQLLVEGFIEVVEGAPPAAPNLQASATEISPHAAIAGQAPTALERKSAGPLCPLRKPTCIGMDCSMSYGCAAKKGL